MYNNYILVVRVLANLLEVNGDHYCPIKKNNKTTHPLAIQPHVGSLCMNNYLG